MIASSTVHGPRSTVRGRSERSERSDGPAVLHIATIVLLLAVGITGCKLKEEAPEPGAPIPAPPDVTAPPPEALRTNSGLASRVLRIGFGQARPSRQSHVTVNYTGWTTDGKMFETNRGVEFRVDEVIAGWTEGLQLMVVGEKRRFWIPGDLAYDKLGLPDRPKGMLVFDIELLNVR